jgi:Tfp pilus assembly protein PilN
MYYLRTSVGIEVRGDDLLLSSLQSNLTAGVYTNFRRVPGFRTRDRAEVRREIDAFFKANRLSRETLVLGIPRQDVIIRHLDLPGEVAENLKQVVYYQVQSFEPSEEEKFYHDFILVRGPEGAKRLQVLVVMVRKGVLDGHLALLKELGLRPAIVTVGSAGLSSVFLQTARGLEKKTFVLIDLKPTGIEVVALKDGTFAYSREVPRSTPPDWKSQLLAEVQMAAARIRLGPDDTIDRILLSGEDSEAAHRELHDEIPECDLVGNHVRFEMPVKIRPHVQESASALGLAWCGMAGRSSFRLNLLPPELRVRQSRWAYVPTVILGLTAIVLLIALGFREVVQERALIRDLDQAIAALKPRVDRVQKVRTDAEKLERHLTYVEGLVSRRDMNLEVLRELTTVLPDETFLSFYQNSDDSIQISGSSSNAPDLLAKLENSKLLKNVVQRGTVFKDAQTGKDRFNFEAKLER